MHAREQWEVTSETLAALFTAPYWQTVRVPYYECFEDCYYFSSGRPRHPHLGAP